MAELAMRAAVPEDRAAILTLLSASLGWGTDERFERFFEWKHDLNPFGPSYGLVAVDGDRIVGFRTFLRWEFVDASSEVVRAVRAVDTATDPNYQGRGIFRALTLRAIEDLADEGVAFVFNTPNDKSRPGYLSMGWTEVGRLRTSVRFASAASIPRMVRARVPAERWSIETSAGRPAPGVLAEAGVDRLLDSFGRSSGLQTNRTAAYLRWRYGFGPFAYRAVMLSDQVTDGMAIIRLRRRGRATETVLSELLVPGDDLKATKALLRMVADLGSGDYVLRIGGPSLRSAGYVRLPRQGPTLTWRALADEAVGERLRDWNLALGDVELF